MTVAIEPYPKRDLLSAPPFPFYHSQQHHCSPLHYSPQQQQQQQHQPQDLLPTPYDLTPFNLGLLDFDLGLTLHIGGLYLQHPGLLSPFITPDSAGDPWMASDHQYINPGGASPLLSPSHLSPEPAPAQSEPSPQQLQGIHQDSFQTRGDAYDHRQARFYLPRHGHTSPYLGDNRNIVAVDSVPDPTVTKQPRRHRQSFIFPQLPACPASPATASTQVMEEHQRSWRNGPSSYPLVDHRFPSSDFHASHAAPGEWQIDQQTDALTRPFTVLKPPKLSRTISDVYSEELYSPEFAVASASASTSQSAGNLDMPPSSGVFAKRVTVANLFPSNSATVSVSTLRDRSPFRQSSLLAPPASRSGLGGNGVYNPGRCDGSASVMMTSPSSATISPEDALLEFSDPADSVEGFTLFPTTPTTTVASGGSTGWNAIGLDDPLVTSPSLTDFSSQFSNHRRPASVSVPQTHQFMSNSLTSCSPVSPGAYFDPQRSSGSDSDSEYHAVDADAATRASILQKPFATATDEGTYTCTYHGCVLRFDSPVLLQRHKREGHRHPHGTSGLRARLLDVGATGRPSGPGGLGVMGSQAGPHRCDRLNPATNKPCSVLFSRPYDLTRHEDTIHNAHKTKSRCRYCNEEKTFSRADALRRHYRVCHPEVEIRAKHRRRLNDGTASIG